MGRGRLRNPVRAAMSYAAAILALMIGTPAFAQAQPVAAASARREQCRMMRKRVIIVTAQKPRAD